MVTSFLTLSIDQNQVILTRVTFEEVWKAMFSIEGIKALRKDGFLKKFYQRNWDIMKSNIFNLVCEVFDG